jgi:hypothetical protein
MKILDIIYPYFCLEHFGQPFEVRELMREGVKYYEPTRIDRDYTILSALVREYGVEETQTMIRQTIERFETEMNLLLAQVDNENDLTYSQRYILSMEGH